MFAFPKETFLVTEKQSQTSSNVSLVFGLSILITGAVGIAWGFYQISDLNDGPPHPWGFTVFVTGLIAFLVGFFILLGRSGFGFFDWTRPH